MNKILKTSLIAFLALTLGCSIIREIKTNYFDLPETEVSLFNSILNIENGELTNKSLDVLEKYIYKYIFAEENPVNNGIKSNYFWYVYNALPDFIDAKERHNGYYSGQNEQSFEEKLIAYSIYRVDRSPENLEKIFNYIKPNIEVIIPPDVYENLGIRDNVNSLIFLYEQVIEIDDYKNKLSDAYNHVDTATGNWFYYENEKHFENFSEPYGRDCNSISEIISSYLGYSHQDYSYSDPNLSFWMRRNHEGNMETVYEILKEIKAIFK
ncbi:MAG: hypothetical protein JXL97_07555 [Bacteroidales bacterium]|nr:hypothetical protein [Bacteroidales bacterium]